MHTDEKKRFDRRNIESSLRKGVVTSKEYDAYLSKLPDMSENIFDPEDEEESDENEGFRSKGND
jgi:hypothetical protein